MNELIDEFIYKNFREFLNSSRINELDNTAGFDNGRVQLRKFYCRI